MKAKLIKIEKNEFDADYADWENQGGSVFIEINGKTVEVVVHPCGELDFEGDELTETEHNDILDFFYTNKKINKAFPADEFP